MWCSLPGAATTGSDPTTIWRHKCLTGGRPTASCPPRPITIATLPPSRCTTCQWVSRDRLPADPLPKSAGFSRKWALNGHQCTASSRGVVSLETGEAPKCKVVTPATVREVSWSVNGKNFLFFWCIYFKVIWFYTFVYSNLNLIMIF